MLPSTFEVDHVVPLHRGGADDIDTNAMALCPNCHRDKTQKERIELMELQRVERQAKADLAQREWEEGVRSREEAKIKITATATCGVSRCSECGQKFYDIFGHNKCETVERRIRNNLRNNLHTPQPVHHTAAPSTSPFDRFIYK